MDAEQFEGELDGGCAGVKVWPGRGRHQDWFRPEVRFTDDRDPVRYDYLPDDHAVVVFREGRAYRVDSRPANGGASPAASDGALRAPMPGKIVAVSAEPGQAVTKGQSIIVLEAMKMEHALTAPFDGVVSDINAAVGDQVAAEAILATVEPSGKD